MPPCSRIAPIFLTTATALEDFSDTAALISQLDLVISVDTSVAHLAGALGKPVWILLTYFPDWRWLLGREDSPLVSDRLPLPPGRLPDLGWRDRTRPPDFVDIRQGLMVAAAGHPL